MDIPQILQSIVLGLVQGLTEFIPVSSSGHLEIVPRLLGWQSPSTMLVVFAHVGTLLALLVYFRKDIWHYLRTLWLIVRKQKEKKTTRRDNLMIIRNVLLASIPAGVIGVLVEKYITKFYDGSEYEGVAAMATLVAMAALGVVFIFSDKWFTKKKQPIQKLSMKRSIFVGLSQALAFIRGVSRSGATIITGQLAGLSRVDAAKFSFLMSIPILLGSSLYGIYELRELPKEELANALPQAVAILASSAIFGFLAIRYLLGYLQNNGLRFFGWYRIAFAIIAALLLFT